MERYARVLLRNRPRWLVLGDDGGAGVLAGGPGTAVESVLDVNGVAALPLLAPCEATKVIGLAYNYKSLVGARAEYDEPLVFLKSPTSLCAHGAEVPYPAFATKVWVEVEVGVVIARRCRNVSVADAPAYILGYTVGGDITAENIHGRDWHLARSKAIDGFAPAGPHLVRGIDTSHLELVTLINGREFQRGTSDDRIVDDAGAVSLVSRYMTLEPGDLILTGTPAGATDAVVKRGDVVTHRIDGLGELRFTIV